MRTICFTVPGIPTAKGRPRMTRTGHTYTDAKTRRAEDSILGCYLAHHEPEDRPHDGPVALVVEAYFPKPKSRPRWWQEREGIPHTSRPDLDNVVKAVQDALNGIAWRDDAQVYDTISRKLYADVPRIDVTIDFLDEVTR